MPYVGPYKTILLFEAPIAGASQCQIAKKGYSTRDLSDLGGSGWIHGDVKKVGSPDAPAWRRVRLFTRRDGRLVREQWSDPVTGAYRFEHINPTIEYTLVAYDHTGQHQAVVSDAPTVDLMP